MSDPSLNELFEAVVEAGKQVKAGFGRGVDIEYNSDGTPVTDIDKAVNRILMGWAADFGNLGFIGEEGDNFSPNQTDVVYVDALDGTKAFIHDSTDVAIVMTHMKKTNRTPWWKPVAAVIHEPLNNVTLLANDRGDGFILEGENAPYNVTFPTASPNLHAPIVTAFSWPGAPNHMEQVRAALSFISRPFKSVAYSGRLIASNQIDAVLYPGPSAVGTAAMSLIVRSARGVATNFFGDNLGLYELVYRDGRYDFNLPYGSIMSSSRALTDRLVRVIASVQ